MIPSPIRAECLSGLREVRHGFFTRVGGVSEGLYTSLNCGLGSRDEPRRVAENRARAAHALEASCNDVVTLYQVHSATALIVDRHIARAELPKADAVVTRTPGLAIGVLAADCAPILFADPGAKVVAAAHAGWRGALAGIAEAAIEKMEELGAKRAHIRASIGPCIAQQDYEVGPEFVAAFASAEAASTRFFAGTSPDGKRRFDLPGYIEHRLKEARLRTVERCSASTYANESLFFSYRRTIHRQEPDYGRHISAIVVA